MLLDAGFNYQIAMDDAMALKHFTLVKKLLSKTSDEVVRGVVEKTKRNLLHTLALYNGPLDIAEKLVSRGINPTALDATNRQPLHYASSPELAQFFLTHGADPSVRDSSNATPLNNMASRGVLSPDLISVLNATGLNDPDNDGTTPLINCVRQHSWAAAAELINRYATIYCISANSIYNL